MKQNIKTFPAKHLTTICSTVVHKGYTHVCYTYKTKFHKILYFGADFFGIIEEYKRIFFVTPHFPFLRWWTPAHKEKLKKKY